MPKKSITSQKITRFLFYLFTFLFISLCTLPRKVIPALETDKDFIVLTKAGIAEESKPLGSRDYYSRIKETEGSTEFNSLNDRSVFLIRVARIEEAENILLSLVKKDPNKITPLLNIFRMYYVLDEYDVIREVIADYLEKTKNIKNQSDIILRELKRLNRLEERVILLDVLSSKSGWEIKALEELGFYFYNQGNYKNAIRYFEQILSANAFHQNALYYMALISLELEKYTDAILYANNLLDEKQKWDNLYYIFLKSNYELGRYREAIKYAEKAPESEKTELEFLRTWKNAALANDIYSDLSNIKIYFHKLKKSGLKIEEKSFFPENDSEGKKVLHNIIQGR